MIVQTPQRQAYSPREMAVAYGIGATKIYEEINADRLKDRKIGRRTLIMLADAERWFKTLPGWHDDALSA